MMKEVQTSELTLDSLFHPNSIAVFGASENENKIGYRQLKALMNAGFKGDLYPINPKSTEIAGLTCYQHVADIQQDVDLAILCVNLNRVEECLIESGKSGVKAAIVFASGYSEIGEEGEKAQERLKDIANTYGMRIIGPNCVGLMNTTNGLMGTFSPGLTEIPLGERRDVGFVTQSGAFGVLTYIAAAQHGLTFNYFVSVGNEVDTAFSDVLEYMLRDEKTMVASGYLEGEKNPEKLRRLGEQALEINKPIIIMKSGRSSAGSRAASSHTGSLAGADRVYDSFFKQTGIVRADDYDDIISFSKFFSANKLPQGRNTAIITSSGGRGINEADRAESYGLNIHPLRKEVKAEIEKNIPSFASALNPVDLTAAAAITHPELFIEPLRVLVNDPDTDIIMFSEFPMEWDENTPVLQEFVEICKQTDKLVFVTTFPLEGMSKPQGTEYLERNGIPVVRGDLNPVRGLTKLVDYSERYRAHQTEKKVQEKVEPQLPFDISPLLPPEKTLSEIDSSRILEAYGVRTTKKHLATTKEEASQFAKKIGFPVVLKVDSSDIAHKTEVNGIQLNLQTEAEVTKAYETILDNVKQQRPHAKVNGVSVQEMLPEGHEVIIGVTTDDTFGPVIMLGIGGVFVEVFKDVAFRVNPITKPEAYRMLNELKGVELFEGVRNQQPLDKEALVDVLLKISRMMEEHQAVIQEIDINPLIVYPDGVVAADALIVKK